MIDAKNPEDVDYTKYGINNALLIDNTGVFRDDKELSRHLQAKGIDNLPVGFRLTNQAACLLYNDL